MDVLQGDDGTAMNGRKGGAKRGPTANAAPADATQPCAPCGACKFLRRKCVHGCIFAPYFGSDQGAARFAAVHKVFGASNVSKLLLHIPANRRHDAVVTICYEAQARLSDPVYGCVSTIAALQQQVASLQAELVMVQTQLMNSRYAVANALQTSHHQQPPNAAAAMMQPASAYSNNLVDMINSFNTASFQVAGGGENHVSQSFEHLNIFSRPSNEDDEDEEEQSQDPVGFTNHMFN
ncbi:hypothetical protein LIER_03829 [Lithospermum erythrorhizon]|uniref:LOB domain-containing protein n=1 Tax=Lithospermum erythrorhizon TaxID=34254 RepID=A0AAV3NZ79_LITER